MRVFILFFFLSLIASCDKSVESPNGICAPVLVQEDAFLTNDVFSASIISLSIDDDCLRIKVGISGCDADQELDLVTDGSVMESLPVQMLLELKNDEPQVCLAYFEVERSFDLKPLSNITDEDTILLSFRNSDRTILYHPS